MTSTGNPSLGSKAHQQISQAPLNLPISSGDQRSFNTSGNVGIIRAAEAIARNQANPRSIQASKSKHKSHRKPRIGRDDDIAEAIAMTSNTASRKGRTSITHLMDWSLPPPRPQHGNQHHHHGRGARRNPTWGMGSGYHAVDKARYVNANYRFIVDPTGDYRAQAIDPDSPVPWTSTLQILASSITQTSSCPICLCDPVAPRMARCGHIFCLPCLIRYMASTEDPPKPGQQGYYHPTANQNKQKWKKCPICYDAVYMNEVRPVKFYTGQEVAPPREGSDVVLRLMMREPGSTLALPKDVASVLGGSGGVRKKGEKGGEKEVIPWHYTAEVTDYARVMKGTKAYLVSEFEREIADLEEQERVDELMFGDETDWVQKAIRKVRNAIEKVEELPDKDENQAEKILERELYERQLLQAAKEREEQAAKRAPIVQQTEVEIPDMYLATSSANQNGYHTPTESQPATPSVSQPPEPIPTPTPQPKSPTLTRAPRPIDTHDPTAPYFFYQSLPHAYLSPLDIRILKVAFGSFAAFPSTVLPRVENFSTGHLVDDDLRKRAKYLAHLPYGCEVAFLECDWTDIVPAEVLEKFLPDLERRRKKKREKDNREERDRVRAEREEDEKRYSGIRKVATGGGHSSVPRGEEDEIRAAIEASRQDLNFNAALPEEDAMDEDTEMPNGPRLGFGNLPQSSPPNTRSVWGTPSPLIMGGGAPVVEKKVESNAWLEGWEKDIIKVTSPVDTSGGGKGKKKFKKVTLMTNTGKRGA